MSQITFRPESTSAVRELAIAVLKQINAVKRVIRTFAAELLILAVMLVAGMALKLVQIAVSNASVADALSGKLFF